jgi:hypothetical protein
MLPNLTSVAVTDANWDGDSRTAADATPISKKSRSVQAVFYTSCS